MNKCIDCGKEIYFYAKRCQKCFGKYYSKNYTGENNALWKPPNRCLDCNKIILRTAKRCSKCWYKLIRGKSNPNYKNGEYCKCCVNCNQIISRHATRCQKCHRKYMCEKYVGKNNPNYRHGRGKCIQCGKTIWFGSKHCQLCMGGKNSPRYGKPPTYYRIIYRGTKFRCLWEANFAKWLDLSDIKWEYEKTFDLGNCTYHPDFYLSEFNLFIEIKGWHRPLGMRKYRKFKRLYPNKRIKLFEYKQLHNLGIL